MRFEVGMEGQVSRAVSLRSAHMMGQAREKRSCTQCESSSCVKYCVQAQAVTLTVWQAFNVAQDRWREQQNKKSVRSKDNSNKAQVG